MGEVANTLWRGETLFSQWAPRIEDALNTLPSALQKAAFIQDQLVGLLKKKHRRSGVVTQCVATLRLTQGRMSVRELARLTGYTPRYLDLLFSEHVGLSPKVLAGIFRFNTFYRKWAKVLFLRSAQIRSL